MFGVEQHRGLIEQVEHEDEHSGQEHDRLQRDLDERAHQERVPAFVFGLCREVSLHLALVATEIRQHQEQTAQQSGPERVGLSDVEREIDGLQPPRRARDT